MPSTSSETMAIIKIGRIVDTDSENFEISNVSFGTICNIKYGVLFAEGYTDPLERHMNRAK